MKIYVILGGWSYECCESVSVFDNYKDAEDEFDRLNEDTKSSHDYYLLEELELGVKYEG